MKEQLRTMSLRYISSYKWAFVFLIGFFGAHTKVNAQGEGKILVDEIIAKVDNYIILKSDLELRHQQYLANGQYGANLKCQILADLVSQKLMVAKAEIDSVIVLDAEVDNNLDRRVQMIIAQTGGSEERLEEYYGKSMEQIRSEIRDDLKEQLTVQKMQGEITKDIDVTPAEVKRFYNSIPADSLPYFSTEVEVAQIVKVPEIGKKQKMEARQKLLDLKRRVLGGEDFNTLAKEYSQGPSAQYGGELGFSKRGTMVPAYEAGALKLKPGEISDPVESEFGLHLIQLIERRGNEYNSRHILMRPSPSLDDIADASKYLDSLRTLIVNDSISFEKAAKEYSDDQFTASNGGFFQDQSGASRVSVEDLDPVIFFTIDSMQVENVTKPLEFRMDDGKEAVRILYYKSKIRPHQANLKQDWQKIQIAAENQKKVKILNNWFEKAKYDVFINIDDTYKGCNIMNKR